MTGTIPIVKLDLAGVVPLHEQVAAEIRRAIGEGECGPGDRLPPAVDLAAVLGVNRNTVLRALRTLRAEELLEFRRGRGVHVTAAAPARSIVIERARELVKVGRRNGVHRDELLQIVSELS